MLIPAGSLTTLLLLAGTGTAPPPEAASSIAPDLVLPALPPLGGDQRMLLRRALEEDCGVGEEPPLRARLERDGASLVPHLAAALVAGPPLSLRAEVEATARRHHALLLGAAAWRKATPLPLPAYIGRELRRHAFAYRQRTLRALGWIGGEPARAALRMVADPDLRPYADLALADAADPRPVLP